MRLHAEKRRATRKNKNSSLVPASPALYSRALRARNISPKHGRALNTHNDSTVARSIHAMILYVGILNVWRLVSGKIASGSRCEGNGGVAGEGWTGSVHSWGKCTQIECPTLPLVYVLYYISIVIYIILGLSIHRGQQKALWGCMLRGGTTASRDIRVAPPLQTSIVKPLSVCTLLRRAIDCRAL